MFSIPTQIICIQCGLANRVLDFKRFLRTRCLPHIRCPSFPRAQLQMDLQHENFCVDGKIRSRSSSFQAMTESEVGSGCTALIFTCWCLFPLLRPVAVHLCRKPKCSLGLRYELHVEQIPEFPSPGVQG